MEAAGLSAMAVHRKNSVSPLKEPGYGQAEKRPSFSEVADLIILISLRL
jgi:hypothetical protein